MKILQDVDIDGEIEATSFVKTGGTSSQFLKADGSVDTTVYTGDQDLSSYLPLSGGTMTGDLQISNNELKFDESGVRSWGVEVGSGNLNISSGDGAGNLNINNNIKVGDGTADDRLYVYYSDGSHTRMQGYGLTFDRSNSYLRPTTDLDKNLFIGTDTAEWQNVVIDAESTKFNQDGTEIMRIHTDGNVGIGTDSPAEKLTVSGGANITGKFAVGAAAVHPSIDFYNQGTAYFNGTTTVDDDLNVTGDTYAEDNIYLTDGLSTVRGKIQLNSSDRDNLDIKAVSLGSTMNFFTEDTLALSIDDSQDATFSGDVTADSFISETLQSPTYTDSFISLNDDGFVGNAVSLNSVASMLFVVDGNDNGTNDNFHWMIDGPSETATEIMKLRNTGTLNVSDNVEANAFIKDGGTSSQYLMADGSTTTSSGGGGTIDGSGTVKMIAKFSDSDTLTDSNIYEAASGEVHINTTTEYTGMLNVYQDSTDPALLLIADDAGSSASPLLSMHRDSSSPADDDVLGRTIYAGNDSAGTEVEYAHLDGYIDTATAGTFNTGGIHVQSRFGSTMYSNLKTRGNRSFAENQWYFENTIQAEGGIEISSGGVISLNSTAGTSGEVLVSKGTSSPEWEHRVRSNTTESGGGAAASVVGNIVKITQTAYSNLGTPDADTLYIIVG